MLNLYVAPGTRFGGAIRLNSSVPASEGTNAARRDEAGIFEIGIVIKRTRGRLACHIFVKTFLTLLALAATWCCGCASHGAAKSPVRAVKFKGVPEIPELAERARKAGNELYPRVLASLGEDASTAPKQFSIVFQRHASVRTLMGDQSGGYARGTVIYFGIDWLTNSLEELDSYLAHEMAHVAQAYSSPTTPGYWQEGIADYVRFQLGYTNGWLCAECSAQYPHYTSGYTCAAAFLRYLETNYDRELVRKLNALLRDGNYTDDFFNRATGKPLDELWSDFKKTPAFTPRAAELLKLEESLGYVNGRPSTNTTREAIDKVSRARGLAVIRESPRGALVADALEFLTDLRAAGKLPGCGKDEHGSVELATNTLKKEKADYPFAWTFHATKQGSRDAFYYTVVRETPESAWQLQRAWRSNGGKILEDYPVP